MKVIKIFSDGFKVSRKRERFKITLEGKKPVEIASNKIASFLIFGEGLFGSAALELAAEKGIPVIFVTKNLQRFHFLEPDMQLGEKSLEVDLILVERLKHITGENELNNVAFRIISQYKNNISYTLQELNINLNQKIREDQEKNNDYGPTTERQILEKDYFKLLADYTSLEIKALESKIQTFRQLLALEVVPVFIKHGVSVSHKIMPCKLEISYPLAYQSILDIYPVLVDFLSVKLIQQKKISCINNNLDSKLREDLATFSRTLEYILREEVNIPMRKNPLTLRELLHLQIRGIINALVNPFSIYKPVSQEVLKSLKF